jgi:hypothetical protein
MTMSFGRQQFKKSFIDSLQDSVSVFSSDEYSDLDRHIDHALADYSRYRPYKIIESITLVSGTAVYAAPAGFVSLIESLYGKSEIQTRKPWDDNYPKYLPAVKVVRDDSDKSVDLVLSPAPDAHLFLCLGADYQFICKKLHVLDNRASLTTIPVEDRELLLLRCQAEAMKEMAMRNSHKPVTIRDGVSGTPRNSTPAALYDQLIKEFEKVVM